MGRKLIILCGVMFIASLAHGSITIQTPSQETAITEINNIKMQPDKYICAESTCATWEEALDNAQYLLGSEIEMWFKSQNQKDVSGYVAKAQKSILGIQSMRGNRYRAFLYVKKEDVMPYSVQDQLVVVPISGEGTSINKLDNGQTNMTPAPSLATSSMSQSQPQKESQADIYQPTKFEQEILSITDANNIGSFIKRLQSEGKIAEYGKYKDMPPYIDCYLFVYNRDMMIPAHLKKSGQTYINLKTGKSDQVTNYQGCGAYWFKLK
ncbi:MAG: hypothetical protein KBT27_01955 [Prevotellaceae bacterium]|nr:hypothetical protein [Candidatus Faecinaster equi]